MTQACSQELRAEMLCHMMVMKLGEVKRAKCVLFWTGSSCVCVCVCAYTQFTYCTRFKHPMLFKDTMPLLLH